MASIYDVAKLAGVSPTTAKRALRSPEALHPNTLKKVQQAVEALQYEPDARAKSLKDAISPNVGLVLGSFVEPFFGELARSIARNLRNSKLNLIVTENEYDSTIELEELKQLYSQRIGALIVRRGYGEASAEYLQRLQDRGVYILEIDYRGVNSPYDSVMLDNEGCVRMGVNYLADLGHTRIAALSKYDSSRHPETRSFYFPKVMEERTLPLPDEYQRMAALSEEAAYHLTHELMRLDVPPTALFALTGTQTAGAYRALQELGLKVGSEISLLGFDNYSWTTLVTPGIDVIEQPTTEMGAAAAQIVLDVIQNGPPAEPISLRFPGRLIKRGSCIPPVKQ
ncbi:LacI family DNA-binding transcriptional regulator [Deinococcus roseus]|uniref:LacI family transcriptional regulator n=1 Tax=Deinococcus roseus TaxID=392414 RepID=A0ABQ2D0Q6_9DEIO|nr:LacI family DNA-binding transcriptional regulator [Deinococcus roseus]GGJ36078.1 LacI family transcriptional regulator [Deinococcus roseus]